MGAERGLPMICQKPLARTLEEARELVEVAEGAGATLAVHENFRFMPWYQEAYRLIQNGRFGSLHTIAFRLRPGDGQGPRAYLERQPYFQKMERFLVHETAIHFIDTFRFLMGEVKRVFAWLRRMNPVIAGEDAGYILFDFVNGSSGIFDGNRLNDHVTDYPLRTMGEMWLEGSAGALRLDGSGRLWWRPHRGLEEEHKYTWKNINFGGDCTYNMEIHIFSHFTAGTPLQNDGRAYLRNLEIEEAVYRSAAEGRWVDV
jgi:predicted dehydrogenase